MDKTLTHMDQKGHARMVDISAKDTTLRTAVARARLSMKPETLSLIMTHGMPKGDALSVARIAGIMGAKRTSELIPLCHPIALTSVEVSLTAGPDARSIDIQVTARTTGRTGVEMEALTGASVAALTMYDMCKAVDREMCIESIRLCRKSGGKSGEFVREEEGEEDGTGQ